MGISGISREQALDCLKSTDLVGIGMEADAVRLALHPEGVVTYAVGDGISVVGIPHEDDPDTDPKPDPKKLLELHRQAHGDGIGTSIRMVIGAGEGPEQRVDHLFAIRAIQEETGGFAAFTLSCSQPQQGGPEAPTAVEYLRTLAVSRMVLDNIENVESRCVEQGLKVAQMALRFGANDAGAIPAKGFSSFTEEDLRRVIRDAGFKPVERDALYRMMFLGN